MIPMPDKKLCRELSAAIPALAEAIRAVYTGPQGRSPRSNPSGRQTIFDLTTESL
jgi:hypothetical protein